MEREPRKSQELRPQNLSGTFSPCATWGAWGARGPEFKSRRSDHAFRASLFEPMDTFMDTLRKQGTAHEAILILLPRSVARSTLAE